MYGGGVWGVKGNERLSDNGDVDNFVFSLHDNGAEGVLGVEGSRKLSGDDGDRGNEDKVPEKLWA